jgi:hypothetical protein
LRPDPRASGASLKEPKCPVRPPALTQSARTIRECRELAKRTIGPGRPFGGAGCSNPTNPRRPS